MDDQKHNQKQTIGLYPVLPEQDPETKIYRLKKIEDIQSSIINERNRREATYKKIQRLKTTIHYVDIGAEVVGGISGAVGIPALLGVISSPIGLVLEGMCVAGFAASMAIKYVGRRLAIKARKHDRIRALADAKLNTIQEYVSRAINDGDISHLLITSELKKFNDEKEKIRKKVATDLQAQTQTDIEKEIEKRVEERVSREKKVLIEKLGQ